MRSHELQLPRCHCVDNLCLPERAGVVETLPRSAERTQRPQPSVFFFAAAGITGGVGLDDAEGELFESFGSGLGSGESPPQPLSSSPAATSPATNLAANLAAKLGHTVRMRHSLPIEVPGGSRTRVNGESTTR